MQFMRALINTLACPTEVLVAMMFLLESRQCISCESTNVRAELCDIFNSLLRNYVLFGNLLRKKRL